MTCAKLLVFLYVLRVTTSDWISEWMSPIQDQFGEDPDKFRRSSSVGNLKLFEDEYQKMLPFIDSTDTPTVYLQKVTDNERSVADLKLKLETTLENAKMLAEALKSKIIETNSKEMGLKEAITHGRNGISTVSVSTIGRISRNYIIREGTWTLCTGILQAPTPKIYGGHASSPHCYGQVVPTNPDPCVFNSVIKYETVPTRRRMQYVEDDYLCLKTSFNATLEQYMSVPKRVINETCKNGMIRSLEENVMECSLRMLSEYSYYPNRGSTSPDLPLEYCTEADGSCKLLVAWHVSNSTIENFEFLKDEPNFKKYFIRGSANRLGTE